MRPDETQVRSIVQTVWSTQLGLEIRNLHEPAEGADSPMITATIHISGDFSGGIRFECSKVLIRQAASVMFDRPGNQLNDDDDRDVIGELANVIAGNIKALIPGSNSISLPTIIDGTDYVVSNLDVKFSDEFGFTHEGKSMKVTLLEHGG